MNMGEGENRCLNPWWAIAPAMGVPFLGSLGYFVVLTDTPFAGALYWISKLFILLWPVGWLLLVERSPFDLGLSRQANLKKSLAWGIVSGLVLAIFLIAAYRIGLKDFLVPFSPLIKAKAVSLNLMDNYIPFAVFLSLINAGIEEYYWRWFVFGRLERFLRLDMALLLGSAAFALHHFVILWQFFGVKTSFLFSLGVAIGGILWALVYRRTGSLLGPWLSHVIVDAAIMTVGYDLIFKV